MRVFLIAGEPSGDALGALLMRALRRARPDIEICGVGGAAMSGEGLVSLFPMSDIAVMGLLPVLARLPRLVARIRETARAVVAQKPDCLVLIDAPDFTHRVARRVRRALPGLPIVDYVSPTVWAWRPGRARAMRDYIDCVLAVLPFEPEAYSRLRGPPCIYVGHPLVEHLEELTPRRRENAPSIGGEVAERGYRDFATPPSRAEGKRAHSPPLLLVLPGSRLAEIERMTPLYGAALELLLAERSSLDVAIPAAPNVEAELREKLRSWPVQPRLLSQNEKFAAFRRARAALVTSGAATLELALAGVPMAVAYKVSLLEYPLRHLITVDSIVLPNLVLGARAVPEFVQGAATPRALADALRPLIDGGEARETQRVALTQVREKILQAGRNPSAGAAEIILERASWRHLQA